MAHLSVRGVDHYFEWISDRVTLHQIPQPHPNRPVMVFLHGWGGSCRYWRQTARYLSERYDCLLYDLRGFGRSRLPVPLSPSVAAIGYELETYADDLEQLLTALGINRVSINAHSAGASIAVLFLERYGHRVQRVILTCHGIFVYNPITFKLFHGAGRYVVAFRPRWLTRIPFIDRMFMARFLHKPIAAQDRQEFLDDFLQADYDAALGTIYTAVSKQASESMPQAFTALTTPTLLISGEFDEIIPPRLGKSAAALSTQVQHVVLPRTGHFPMLEDWPTYQTAMDVFLKSEAPQPSGV